MSNIINQLVGTEKTNQPTTNHQLTTPVTTADNKAELLIL